MLSLQGCTGYALYEQSHYDDIFSDLYREVRNKDYLRDMPSQRYSDKRITKKELIKTWGMPYDIKVRGSSYHSGSAFTETWYYSRGIRWGGLAPILIVPVPIPIFWWFEGAGTVHVSFVDGVVVGATEPTYAFNDGVICLFLPPLCDSYPVKIH